MRIYLVILIFISFSSAPVFGDDVILGVIQSIDLDKGELEVKVIDSSINIEKNSQKIIKVKIEHKDLSNKIESGKVVRIWGSYAKEISGIFKARSITGRSFGGRKNDPTGVRSRLGRRIKGPIRGHHRR